MSPMQMDSHEEQVLESLPEHEWFPGVPGVDTSKVPFRVEDPLLIPAERYYDEAFLAAEKKLFMHTWQHACHASEIPKPGDFTEYRIFDQSVMLIRQEDGSVKAFHNACRHRGTALACGTGSFRGGQVVCPFHGWRWSLDGENTYVYAKDAFRDDTVEQSEVNLTQVQVAERWGFVWINFDPNAPSFEESAQGISGALDPNWFENMRVAWWHQIEFEGNWKVAQEAFMEAYHVMSTHSEMAAFVKDDDFNALAFAHYCLNENGHGWADGSARRRFIKPGQQDRTFVDPSLKSGAEMFHATVKAQWEGSQAQTSKHIVRLAEELIEEGVSDEVFFPEIAKRIYADAASRGVTLPPPAPGKTGHWTHFPNFVGVCVFGNGLVYRSRPHPTDPNKCIYDFWALEIAPEGEPVTRPRIGADDAPTWDDLWFVQQDANNIERIQLGLRSQGLTHARLGPDVEAMIVNWHLAADREMAKWVDE